MNPNLKEKMETALVGYGFLGLHLYAGHLKVPQLFVIGFAIVAAIFFIKALRIKP